MTRIGAHAIVLGARMAGLLRVQADVDESVAVVGRGPEIQIDRTMRWRCGRRICVLLWVFAFGVVCPVGSVSAGPLDGTGSPCSIVNVGVTVASDHTSYIYEADCPGTPFGLFDGTVIGRYQVIASWTPQPGTGGGIASDNVFSYRRNEYEIDTWTCDQDPWITPAAHGDWAGFPNGHTCFQQSQSGGENWESDTNPPASFSYLMCFNDPWGASLSGCFADDETSVDGPSAAIMAAWTSAQKKSAQFIHGFDRENPSWQAFGAAGIDDESKGLARSGTHNGWVAAIAGQRTWSSLSVVLPDDVVDADACAATVWIKTSPQLVNGEIDVRDASGRDVMHVGPFGPWPPSSRAEDNGYGIVRLPGFPGRRSAPTEVAPLTFVVGLWGDGSANSEWIRVDDLSVQCSQSIPPSTPAR
jgi:hypothetical protein